MDGMKVSPMGQFTWLVFYFLLIIFFLAQFLFLDSVFTSFFGTIFIPYFFGPPLNQCFFGKLLTTPKPTFHPSSYQPTSFPHAADPSPPRHLRSLLVHANALLAITIGA
jgi:hypothetical protein